MTAVLVVKRGFLNPCFHALTDSSPSGAKNEVVVVVAVEIGSAFCFLVGSA